MAGDHRALSHLDVARDDLEVGPAHTAGRHLDDHLAGAGDRIVDIAQREVVRRCEDHRLHDGIVGRTRYRSRPRVVMGMRRRRHRRTVAAAGILLAAAGCMGTGSGTGPISTVTVSTGGGGTITSEPPASSGVSTAVVVAPPHAPKRLARLCGETPCDDFATPSGNIKCFAAAYNGGSVECAIGSGLVPVPTSPPCDLDRPGLVVGASGSARPSCRGDPTPAVLDSRIPALPYDAVWEGFGVHCFSQTSGLTCVNRDGHGFFLSRERWRLF
jgi:hypothetical protein